MKENDTRICNSENEERPTDMVNIWVIIKGYFSLLKICMVIESKKIYKTMSNEFSNGCRCNTYNYEKGGRVRGSTWLQVLRVI